jgi:hypothetical protein
LGLAKIFSRLTFASTISHDNGQGRQQARVAQLVEHDLAKVGVASSNLVSRSIKPLQKGFFVSGLVKYNLLNLYGSRISRDGGIGRHARLKILCPIGRAGSSPAPGTEASQKCGAFCILGKMSFE